MASTRVLILSALALPYAVFAAWTWRRLWRPATTPREQVIYGFGVRGWGVAMWITMGIALPVHDAWESHQAIVSLATLANVLIMLAISGPIMLWGGYW